MSTDGLEKSEEKAASTQNEETGSDSSAKKKSYSARSASSAEGDSADRDSYDDSQMMEDDSDPESYGSDYHSDYDSDARRRRKQRGLGEAVVCRPLEVVVRDDRVEQAIRQLKNRMAREGVLRELKNRRHYFKPSELKRIKSREAARRRRKQVRQKIA